MDIAFHCDCDANFKSDEHVRAFLYKNYFIEPHNHDFYEINIVMAGTGTHQIENNLLPVKAGDVFIIPPMVVHAYFDTHQLEVYHILLRREFIQANLNEAGKVRGFLQFVEIEPFLHGNFEKAQFLTLSFQQQALLKHDLTFLEEDEPDRYPLKNHTAWKILYWFSSLLYQQMNAKECYAQNRYEVSVIKALEYIHTHFDQKITVDFLHRLVFLSRSTFLRNFYAVCGCTPAEYLNRLRCKKALELLDIGTLTKTQIAHDCGFYDLSHMERQLKKHREHVGTVMQPFHHAASTGKNS